MCVCVCVCVCTHIVDVLHTRVNEARDKIKGHTRAHVSSNQRVIHTIDRRHS